MKSKNLSEKILRSVKSKGFKYIQLPSIIETNHIVQRSGENFRKFIFSFTDQKGNELCLRPDLTIVSCLRYLENNLRGINENQLFLSRWITEVIYWDFPSEFFLIIYCLCLGWTFLIWKKYPPIE